MATSVLQQLFNTADMAVVGRFVGDSAYAAVGSTGTIVKIAKKKPVELIR